MFFDLSNYEADGSSISKQTIVEYLFIPTRGTTLNYAIERTLIKREDNIFASIHGLTEKEDIIFNVKKSAQENRQLNYNGRL